MIILTYLFIGTIWAMFMEEYGLSCLIEYNSWTWEALNEQNSYVHMCGSEKYKAGFLKLIS